MSLAAVLAVLALAVAVGAADKPNRRSSRVTGELTALEAGSVTVKVIDKDGTERTATFTTNDKTTVTIETDEDEVTIVKGPIGDTTMRSPKMKEGTRADLKTGQRVTVITPDEKSATDIWIRRAAKK
jgi:hypothetical protein